MARITIKEIAEKAGVSKAAVSFAFNNPEQLSETTLERILHVAKELGYRPHPVASNLKTRRTGCIGLLVPQSLPEITQNPHLLALMEGVGRVCHEHGLSLMIVPPLKGNLEDAVARAAVDGFLTLGLETFRDTMREIQQRHIPFVMVDSDPVEGISCVNTDDEMGAYLAMNHVVSAGHRQIVILGIESDSGGDYTHYTGTLKRRMEGYLRGLEEANLCIDDDNISLLECDCSIEGGESAFHYLWETGQRPTAIVAMADVIAIGVMQAARQIGLEIPQDVSLVGYDDLTMSSTICPPLTTIRQPTAEKGYLATNLLYETLQNEDNPPCQHTILPVELVERQSVKCAKLPTNN